jgi:hypothetical protein
VALPPLGAANVGVWHFTPASREYPAVTDDQPHENFTGVVRGDVDLSWQSTPGTSFAKITLEQYVQSAIVSVGTDGTLVLSINFRSVASLLSLELSLEYATDNYLFQNLILTGAWQNWTQQVNVASNTLRLAMIGSQAVGTEEIGLEFHFRTANKKSVSSIIKLNQFRVNNLPWLEGDFQIPVTLAFDLPRQFKLDQNYPNPVETETYFPFELPVPETVGLKIYNLLGQEILQLLEQPMPAGQHRFHWFQSGLNATRLPAGIYYYQIQAGQYKAARKFIILP